MERKTKNCSQFGFGSFVFFIFTYIISVFTLQLMVLIPINIAKGGESFEVMLASHWLLYLDAVGFLVALLLFKKTRLFLRGTFSFIPLKRYKTYLYLVLSFSVIYVSQYLIINVLHLEDNSVQIDTFGFGDLSFGWWNLVLLYIAFAVVTPIKEEIFFRGLLYGLLSEKINFWFGLIVSSIIFGLLHQGSEISATIMGMTFILLYKVTKSLVVPIILHVIWNAFAFTSLVLFLS